MVNGVIGVNAVCNPGHHVTSYVTFYVPGVGVWNGPNASPLRGGRSAAGSHAAEAAIESDDGDGDDGDGGGCDAMPRSSFEISGRWLCARQIAAALHHSLIRGRIQAFIHVLAKISSRPTTSKYELWGRNNQNNMFCELGRPFTF
jgi:hypothetical protein